MSRQRVVIVGGGVIGTACAHYLVESGHDVTIIDQGGIGQACSHANCGFVCPSHVLPLNEPGAAKKALKSMFKKDSPFHIKPRLDPGLWQWLLRFAGRCNMEDMLEAAAGIHALLTSSMLLYDRLLEGGGIQCEWQKRGLLFVYKTSEEFEKYGKTNDLLRETFAVEATRYGPREVVELEPALLDEMAGGWHYECDAHLRADLLMTSWRKQLEARGAVFIEQCRFEELVSANGRASAVATSGDEYAADQVIIATGAWTPQLNRQLGCKIPIQPGKGYSLTMPRPQRCPTIPLMFSEHKVAATPMESGYRLGSTMEFAGYDDSINRDRLEMLKRAARLYLHEPYCDPVEEEWYGWRPMTYDGLPVIDVAPDYANVWIAAGHNMLGLSMAPATGKLVAEMIDDRSTHVDPHPYRLDRN